VPDLDLALAALLHSYDEGDLPALAGRAADLAREHDPGDPLRAMLEALARTPAGAVAAALAAICGTVGNRLRRRSPQRAQACYELALGLQPGLPAARQNLGVVLAAQGRLAEAEAQYRASLETQPRVHHPYVNLATLLQDTGRLGDAQVLLAQGLRVVDSGHFLLGSLALTGCWLQGATHDAAHLVAAFGAAAAGAPATREDDASRQYFRLCARLFETMAREPGASRSDAAVRELHVLGESHSLVPAHAVFPWLGHPVRGRSRLVKGVKMYHLATPADNGAKAALRAQLRAMPAQADLLVTVGEIDCRPDEGMWVAQRKGQVPLEHVVDSTVDGYLGWLERELASMPLRTVTLQGVPAPTRAPPERAPFLRMVHAANARLRAGCAARRWHFLDVHAATADSEGAANARWHLDAVHLRPGFYMQADTYLRRP
jgi:tetratricopeptide (TPR) repeat protein